MIRLQQAFKLGITVHMHSLDANLTQDDLIDMIKDMNTDNAIDGIMIQKPLPSHIDDNLVNATINPNKDLDCLSPLNLGKLVLDQAVFMPATPYAVHLLMRFYDIDPIVKELCILGRSPVVGKPLANILLGKRPYTNATLTVCHSRTRDIAHYTKRSDIIISAIGKAGFVTGDMIKDNAILIDVGINEVFDNEGKSRYVGDIDYDGCSDRASAITPVPGGIGTITTAVLLMNLLKATLLNRSSNKIIDDFDDLIFNAN